MTATTTRKELTESIGQHDTAALATALQAFADLDTIGELDEAERLVRNVIIETLYDRHPEIVAAYDIWIDDLESEDTASDVVIRAARQLP
ncbi:hypothetical protein ACQP2U_43650 (plasmid) [Nocardia sp. CA-084685]|uniref:hypothetical protein n=1 Tax=Nocardia sp. CA-084685 TaxID=3239970 RepID=UPI003D962114